jgi:hypothetical protein
MAQIQTETIVINFSKLVKTGAEGGDITSAEIQAALEQVAQELVGDGVVVEVERA